MIASRPARAALIGLCFALMILPTMRYYRTPPEWSVMGVLRTTFPAWLFLFGALCLGEGQDRERRRASREQDDQDSR
jgi:hypothetical protein